MDAKNELANTLSEAFPGNLELIKKILDGYTVARENEGGRNNLKKRISYFLGAKKTDGLSDRTIGNYRYNLELFASYVNKHITKITTDDIREYIGYLSETRHLRESSLQTHINTLRTFFSWMNMEGIVKKNPMMKIKSLKIDKKGARHALTPEELERLRDACRNYKEKALVEFLVSTGCRLSEAGESW